MDITYHTERGQIEYVTFSGDSTAGDLYMRGRFGDRVYNCPLAEAAGLVKEIKEAGLAVESLF